MPRPRPFGSLVLQCARSAASLTTACCRGLVTPSSAMRYSTGSAPAACAHSSMNDSKQKPFCPFCTARQAPSGTGAGTRTKSFSVFVMSYGGGSPASRRCGVVVAGFHHASVDGPTIRFCSTVGRPVPSSEARKRCSCAGRYMSCWMSSSRVQTTFTGTPTRRESSTASMTKS